MRVFANACGTECPQALTSTKLRKHAATLSTVLNMTESEMDQLANFLGHDIRIHQEFYQLPNKTLQLAKISKLLIALEEGKVKKFQGMNLDQITVDPDERLIEHEAEEMTEFAVHSEETVPLNMESENAQTTMSTKPQSSEDGEFSGLCAIKPISETPSAEAIPSDDEDEVFPTHKQCKSKSADNGESSGICSASSSQKVLPILERDLSSDDDEILPKKK